MSRAAKFQAALIAVLIGLMAILLGSGGAPRPETPARVFTQRPATEQEQRQWTEDQLYERLRRQQEAAR